MPERSSIEGPPAGEAAVPGNRGVPEKNPHAAALGRLGGRRGGPARALRLSAERRSEIAQRAAWARWHRAAGEATGVAGTAGGEGAGAPRVGRARRGTGGDDWRRTDER